jgi:hypothetical protein
MDKVQKPSNFEFANFYWTVGITSHKTVNVDLLVEGFAERMVEGESRFCNRILWQLLATLRYILLQIIIILKIKR